MSTPHNLPGMGKRILYLVVEDGVFQRTPGLTDEDKAKYIELHDKMIEDLQKLIVEKNLITGTKGEL
jgi:hypothetical protein